MEEDETAPSDGWELLQKDTTKSSTFESNDASNSNTSSMNKCAVQSSFKSESVNNSDMEVDQHKQTNMKRRLGVPVGAPAPKIKRTRQNIAEPKIPKLASNFKNSIESGLLNVKENSPNTDSNTPVQEEAPQSSPLIIPIVDENNVMTVSSNESENAQEYLEKKNVLASSSLSDICNESSLPVCKNTVLDNENIEKRLLPTNNEQFEFSSKIPLQQSPVPENVISPYKYELTDCTTLSSQLTNNASQETPFNSTENIVNSTNLLPVTNHSLLDTITTEPISEATDKLTEEMCKDNYSMNTISSLREKSDLLNTQSEISDVLSNSESKPQSDGLIPQNVLVSIADGAEDTSCDQIKTVNNSPKSPLLQLIETTGNQSENLDTDDQMNDEEASKKVVTRLIPIVLEDDWQLQDKQDKLKEEETTPAITSTNEENGDEPEADKPVDKDSSIMASPDDNENATSLIDDKVKIKMEPNSDEDSDCDSSTKALPRRAGTATELSAKPKVKNLRRNIRDILGEDKLEENTLAAQKEEQLRLQRLQEKRTAMREYMEQQQEERLIAEVAEAAEAVTAAEAIQDAELNIEQEVKEEELPAVKIEDTDVVVLSSEEEKESESSADEDEDEKKKSDIDSDTKSKQSDESDSDSDSDIMVLSQSDEEEESEDANNSGAHINDDFNAPDAQGRVLVNVGHPENEEDIFLAQQLATAVKPHQIGGIRFLYDNIIESIEQYKTSNGFGCILAHSMGLGKTLQVVSFTDIFLRHTEAKNVLIIVPINTIQNWQAEYNQWIPEERPPDTPEETEIRTRNFKVFILNDGQKNIKARARVITAWHEEGGVLLMGYELYRQLSLKKPKKPKKKKKKRNDINSELVDIEEEDKDKELLDEMHKYLVRPGPDLVICDEGHRIKNAHANISQALKNIRTKRRVVLTGYPLQNNLIEYWCMVDFIRPNYLGTKTEFCNMFERPIQNGQCVDSTPQDMTIMRYRAHVLHSLLEGFVQRRGHSVLAKTLPLKQEQVLLCRMTPVQRSLYKAYMAELNSSKAVANPLKAFAICCKIWNHPDVLYNFVMKRMNEDYDLDLDEVVGKPGKLKKGAPGSKGANNSLPFQQPPMPNWNIQQPLMANQQQQSPMKFRPPMSEMGGVSNNMGQTMSPSPMMHMDSNSQMNYNMSNQNMYNMNQNYNMNHMQFTPWGFNQGYSNESSPQQQQHHFSNAYGNFSNQYQQMQQQQQQQQHATMGQTMGHMQQQQLPLAGFHSMGMGPPPAHPSMHPQSPSMTQTNSVAQQGALNLSHQTPNTTGMNQEMSGSMMGQNMPPTNQHMPPSNQPLSLPNSNQSMTSNLLNQQSLPQNNQNGPPLSSPDSEFSKMVSEGHQLQTNIPYQSQQLPEHLPTYLNDSMKNLDIDNSMHADSKDGLSLTPKQEVPMGGKMNDVKGPFTESEDKKDEIKEKKEEFKKEKEEVSYEWAESILKDYELGKVENSTKFQIFFKILEGTIKVKDRLLVFSQSLFTLSQLEEYLQRALIPGTFDHWAKNRSYFRLDGSTSAQEREKLINEFNSNIGIHLFLVSTRAGSLGINLVGANRVIVFDASFNPCHDTQAVCRVYRYGQQKPCHIYRLVTDNSLERRIYDRQVNKQGISDRIVDEMNPDAHLSSKEISNLLVEDEADEDDSSEEQEDDAADINDDILKQIIKEKRIMFTRLPFQHESLLVDRKDKRLSNAEKRLAKRSYERAKQANISYNRPSYSSFYPNNSMMSTKIGGVVYAKPVGTVRPMQSDNKVDGGGTMMHRPNILSRSSHPVENLAKQGVSVQQITVPKDVSIPTNSGDGKPIQLKSGQSVMVIKTQKGMYLRLSDGKIVAIRVPPEEAFGMPLNQGSVTIVPTMNSPRARGRGTRRGRPPLSAQYALGQIVPKGTPKGQVAVRILRKPVGVGRGRKSYQTIAVPVSSSATLLNKSVVITPAKPAPSKYSKDPSKVSPQVQITPVTQGTPRGGLNSIAGTSGINQRLNRNKILSAAKSEEIRKQQLIRNRLAHLSRKDAVLQPTDKDPESKSDDDEASMSSQEELKDDASQSGASQLSKDSPKPEEQNVLPSSTPTSPSTPTSLIPQVALPEEDSSKPIKNIFQSLDTSRSLSGSSSTSEPILGIVKPLVHDNENHVSPLQGLSNLIPPGENGPGPPPSSLAPLSMPPCSSQPLFQPFLQQSSTSSAPTTTYSDAGLTWSKNLDSVSMASNVAHVAPQVQQIAKSEAPAPSFLPSYSSSFTTQGQSLTTPPFSSDSLLHNTDQSPLSLSNLLGTPSNQQQFSHQQEEGQQQSSSALDFLNYPLASASSSAFRRPDYPTGDIFNPVSTHSPSSIASSPPVSSPASFNTTSYPTAPQYNYRMPHAAVPGGFRPTPLPAGYPPYSGQYGTYPGQYPNTTMGQYAGLQTPGNPYQGYPPPNPPGSGSLPPYSSSLSGFGHGSYPPM